MRKFVCTICGYVYNEAEERLKWDELPDNWTCPLCGASKSDFEEVIAKEDTPTEAKASVVFETVEENMKELNNAELSVLCSNLSKGCEKQYLTEQAALFNELSEYYKSKTSEVPDNSFEALLEKIEHNLDVEFERAKLSASENNDRGAKRALTWSEKTTKMLNSLLARYLKEGDAMLENTNIFVCDICGFIYVGNEPPEICPICKVPSIKILKVDRR